MVTSSQINADQKHVKSLKDDGALTRGGRHSQALGRGDGGRSAGCSSIICFGKLLLNRYAGLKAGMLKRDRTTPVHGGGIREMSRVATSHKLISRVVT